LPLFYYKYQKFTLYYLHVITMSDGKNVPLKGKPKESTVRVKIELTEAADSDSYIHLDFDDLVLKNKVNIFQVKIIYLKTVCSMSTRCKNVVTSFVHI